MKKSFLSSLLSLIVSFSFSQNVDSVDFRKKIWNTFNDSYYYKSHIVPFNNSTKKCAYTNKEGIQVTPFIYDYAWIIKNNRALIKKNKKYGFIDTNGTEVIPTNYEKASQFYSYGAYVMKKGLYGLINEQGEILIPFKYEALGLLDDGLIKVKLHGKYGYCNLKGQEVIPTIYDQLGSVQKGMIIAQIENKLGFIGTRNQTIIPFDYDNILSYSIEEADEGLSFDRIRNKKLITWEKKTLNIQRSMPHFKPIHQYSHTTYFSNEDEAVKKNGKWGTINLKNKTVIPFKYDTIGRFSYSDIYLAKRNQKYGLMNAQEEVILPFIYDNIIERNIIKDGKIGHINYNGKVILSPTYEEISEFKNGIARVKKDGKYGYIDKQYHEVIPAIYDTIGSFSKYYFPYTGKEYVTIASKNKKFGMISRENQTVLTFIYKEIVNIGKYLRCYTGTKQAVFIMANISQPPSLYDSIWPFKWEKELPSYKLLSKKEKEQKLSTYINVSASENPQITNLLYLDGYEYSSLACNNGKYGFVSLSGQEVIPAKYDWIGDVHNKRAVVKLNGKYGLINEKGNELTELTYDSLFYSSKHFVFKTNSKYGLLSSDVQVVLPALYDSIKVQERIVAIVQRNNLFGAYNIKTKKEIIPIQYEWIGSTFSYDNKTALHFVRKNKKMGLIMKGKETVPVVNDTCFTIESGHVITSQNNLYGLYYLFSDSIKLENVYDTIIQLSHNEFKIVQGNKMYYYNSFSNMKTPEHYSDLSLTKKEAIVRFKTTDFVGLITGTGELFRVKGKEISRHHRSVYKIQKPNGKEYFINPKGKKLSKREVLKL